jgi:hypothetical protein
MKALKYLLFLLFHFALFSCQPEPPEGEKPDEPVLEASAFTPRVVDVSQTGDTLITSSSTDEIIFSLGSFYGAVEYDLGAFVTNLSGTTNANIILEYSPAMTGSNWYPIDTLAASATASARHTGTIVRGRLRYRAAAPSSTQNSFVKIDGAVVTRAPN